MNDDLKKDNETDEQNDIVAGESETAETELTESTESQTEKQTTFDKIYDWLEVMAVSAVIVILTLTFLFRLSTVDGTSMNNTLSHGDMLVIRNIYSVEQGDIVVVQQLNSFFEQPIVKRIIAVGGQTLKIDFTGWKVWVDGELLNEDYVNRENGKMMKYDDFLSIYGNVATKVGSAYEMTIPEGYVFVMGDNRNHSSDSRSGYVGLVRENEILGKVIFRLLPVTDIGTVK